MTDAEGLSRVDLVAIIVELRRSNGVLAERVEFLEAEVERLRCQLPGCGSTVVPEWVKPNRKERREAERTERKKRTQSFVRRREIATEVHEHAVEQCPKCGRKLCGGWVHRTRQYVEIPETPVRIVEHRIIRRLCGVCGTQCTPQVDLSTEVLGKARVGVRLMSFIAYLHTVCRVPLRTIKSHLNVIYGLDLGLGELCRILHAVSEAAKPEYDVLLEEIRGSPVVNADETGWREDGISGYIWSFSTGSVRYFVYRHSRSGQVAKEVLGEDFDGVVVSDFYCGYSVLLTRHQRCWVHFYRDLKKLVEAYPSELSVGGWVETVLSIYKQAKDFSSDDERTRVRQREIFEQTLLEVGRPYFKSDKPQRILAERIEKFLPELFVFVEDPRVPSENNAAERAVRPFVIAGKVSGGTRSAKGSDTKAVLMSLFGTWLLTGHDTMQMCRQMLISANRITCPVADKAILSHVA